jgi:hypothetical protein
VAPGRDHGHGARELTWPRPRFRNVAFLNLEDRNVAFLNFWGWLTGG